MRLFSVYKIEGLNLDSLINTLKKRKITLYEVSKLTPKRLNVKVKYKDGKKLFAISKELCYNIVKIKDTGLLYPLLFFKRNLGLLIGGIIFLGLSVFSNDFIFSYSFSGSGAVYSQSVREYLENKGVKPFTRFSELNLKTLSSQILIDNDNLSFVSCTKKGNTLEISLTKSYENKVTLTGNVTEFVSPYNGVVQELKVYRGSLVAKVGDKIKKGDLLVLGEAVVKDTLINVNVIAYACILEENVFEYISDTDKDVDKAQAFAMGKTEGEVVDVKTTVTPKNDKYCYTVSLFLRRTILVG